MKNLQQREASFTRIIEQMIRFLKSDKSFQNKIQSNNPRIYPPNFNNTSHPHTTAIMANNPWGMLP